MYNQLIKRMARTAVLSHHPSLFPAVPWALPLSQGSPPVAALAPLISSSPVLPLHIHTPAQLYKLCYTHVAIERVCPQSLGSGELDAPTAEELSLTKTYPVGTKSKGMHSDFTSIMKAEHTYSAFHCLLITTVKQFSPFTSNTFSSSIYIWI